MLIPGPAKVSRGCQWALGLYKITQHSKVKLSTIIDKKEVNAAFKKEAEGKLKGLLEYNTDSIVSVDIIGNTHSCILDSELTMVMGGNMVKVVGWYDNETGYSARVTDLINKVG